jgi:hypothetical protein
VIPDSLRVPAIVFRLTTRLVGAPDVTRTIDVLSTQTLHDLHAALQAAHGWDDDHSLRLLVDRSMLGQRRLR